MSACPDRSLSVKDIYFSDNHCEFLKKFNKKSSNIFAQKYRAALADSKASSGFRPSMKEIFYPLVGSSSWGSMMKDIDGNDDIDITMGYGSN